MHSGVSKCTDKGITIITLWIQTGDYDSFENVFTKPIISYTGLRRNATATILATAAAGAYHQLASSTQNILPPMAPYTNGHNVTLSKYTN